MLAKVEVILLMFILVLTSCYGEKNTCDKETIQKLDESTGIILGQFGIAKYKWPENEAQMEAYCKYILSFFYFSSYKIIINTYLKLYFGLI